MPGDLLITYAPLGRGIVIFYEEEAGEIGMWGFSGLTAIELIRRSERTLVLINSMCCWVKNDRLKPA